MLIIVFALVLPYVPRTLSIGTAYVTASTGKAVDIQTAIDQCEAGGGGVVHIPEGTYNFYEVGETWNPVRVPETVCVYGAETQKDSNGQVIEWKTSLVMPFEAPSGSIWFLVEVVDGYDEQFRFSDIELVGWRYYDYLANGVPNFDVPYTGSGERGSTTMYTGLSIGDFPYNTQYVTEGVNNFRVDHCNFQDMAGNAVWVGAGHTPYNRRTFCGVIDHNRMVNSYGDPGRVGVSSYEDRTLDYGIGIRRWACDLWESDVTNIFGQYNDYTVVIEDNYFSKWRHCVCSNDGMHYVFRHNTVEGDYGTGSVDAHGSFATSTRPYAVGTRCVEVYDNLFTSPDTTWEKKPWVFNCRGGSAVVTNNQLVGYYSVIFFNDEYANDIYVPECSINHVYVWSNTGATTTIGYVYDATSDVDFFLRAPTVNDDGFVYSSLIYPHPIVDDLVVEPEPTDTSSSSSSSSGTTGGTEAVTEPEPEDSDIPETPSTTEVNGLLPVQVGLALVGAYVYITGGKKKK